MVEEAFSTAGSLAGTYVPADAVKNTVYGAINEDCPATIMRLHNSAVLYCDADSGIHLKEETL